MAVDNGEELEIHPLIEAQEPDGEPSVELRGFLGSGDGETLRLYTDLSMSSYVDIPREGVIHIEKDPSGETGKVRAFVRADQKIRHVLSSTLVARQSELTESLFRAFGTGQVSFPPLILTSRQVCFDSCERQFAAAVAEWTVMLGRASYQCSQTGVTSEECFEGLGRATQFLHGSVRSLRQCLVDCLNQYPTLSRFDVDALLKDIVEKYVPGYFP